MIALNTIPASFPSPLHILHLEDSPLDHGLVRRALTQANISFEIQRVETLSDFSRAIESQVFHIVLADYRLPGFTALDAWAAMQAAKLHIPFVLLSGAIGEAAAVQAVQLGVSDYLHKDALGTLGRVIHRALEISKVKAAEERANQALAFSERRLAEFAGHLQDTIENERASIAREIHDDIGGSLAAVKLDLAWLSRHTAAVDAREHLASATDMLQHALGASQRIMMNLRPSILDQGLAPALQWLVSSFEKRTGISTELVARQDQVPLDRAIELTAYRTTQEALTNVSKHAKCSAVRVEMSDSEGVLTLEITDDGQGISSADLEKPRSFGVRGLQERAKSAGGWLDVSSVPGKGTSIILSIPLAGGAQGHDEEQFQ